jgi:hypothetical protein
MSTANPKRIADQEHGIGSLLSHFVESVLPLSVRSAGIEERRRARVLVGFTLALFCAAIFIIGIQTLRGP